jgi:ABC-type glutathione transport system ATPase component
MNDRVRKPYPGLRAFESSESDLFFGREGCVDEMLAQLARTRFLAVLGTSGSGKSSLVRTGLMDALELGFLSGTGSRWLTADMHPGGRPIRNLARALMRAIASAT